jgi:hypothetical protein
MGDKGECCRGVLFFKGVNDVLLLVGISVKAMENIYLCVYMDIYI